MPILSLGILGTFASAALIAVAAHVLFDLSWITSGMLGAALAPTDPAVTFSVLGGREIRGRTGTILKGESGANDPVGIALMIGMIELATSDHGSFWTVVEEFVVEMAGGVAVGVAGAALLLPLMRRVPLPSPALYPLRVVAAAGVIYGAATLVHGSGFLAVFVAGILIGDRPVPHRREIDEFLASIGSLAEIAMFVALGLTIDLTELFDSNAWFEGLVLAALLAFAIRPLVVGALLLPVRLDRGERLFVMWSGLKGAVPILLAALALIGGVDDGNEIYGIVFVVVLFSVLVQGTLVPKVAERLNVPMERRSESSRSCRSHGRTCARAGPRSASRRAAPAAPSAARASSRRAPPTRARARRSRRGRRARTAPSASRRRSSSRYRDPRGSRGTHRGHGCSRSGAGSGRG